MLVMLRGGNNFHVRDVTVLQLTVAEGERIVHSLPNMLAGVVQGYRLPDDGAFEVRTTRIYQYI